MTRFGSNPWGWVVGDLPEMADWVTVPQAARMLKVSRQGAWKMVIQGRLKTAHRIGWVTVLARSEVEEWVQEEDSPPVRRRAHR